MKHQTKGYTRVSFDPKKGFRTHLLVFLLTPAIWLVWYLTDRSYPWPLWSTPMWAIGILFHYLGVFVFRKHRSTQSRQQHLYQTIKF